MGSEPLPYHISARLGTSGIQETACSCPYDWGGDCKHIVALLLTYLHEPESFEGRPTLDTSLQDRSKDDLIDLIKQMVERYPDLQRFVDRPAPAAVIEDGRPVDTQAFRKELHYALNNFGGWGDRTAEFTLREITRTAKRFATQGDWKNAVSIYCAIVEECVAVDGAPVDDEGEYSYAFADVLGQLAECLEQPAVVENEVERRKVLNALLMAYIWDVDFGGVGISDDVPDYVETHARPDDLTAIRKQIIAAQQHTARNSYSMWGVRVYEEFLMRLDGLEQVDPEITLKRLRDGGHYQLLAEKLLELKRPDEALTVMREHLTLPYEQLQMAYLLVTYSHDDLAIQMAEESLQQTHNPQLADWLIGLYRQRGDHESLLRWELKQMQSNPDVVYYAGLKPAAQTLGNWEMVQAQVLKDLEAQGRYDTLVQIYLYDEEWDKAWETLPKVKTSTTYLWGGSSLEFEVAQKTRHARPARAIPVYMKHARSQINRVDRRGYASAAELLHVVRELYDQMGDEETWLERITELREEFANRPALQDEWDKAGL